MRIEGACHCGSIAYEADVDPETVAICHCTDCQTLSGSAFRTVVPAKKDAFKLVRGQPKVYVKTAENGNRRVQAFCPDCGTPVYSSAVENPETFSIRLGTAKQRAELRPKVQMRTRSARDWVTDIGSLKRLERGR